MRIVVRDNGSLKLEIGEGESFELVDAQGNAFGLEAAHIQWHAAEGPDTVANGLLLCVLHHRALDRGVIGLETDGRIKVSPTVAGGEVVEQRITRFHGARLRPPEDGQRPGEQFVAWHDRQVFRPAHKQAAR